MTSAATITSMQSLVLYAVVGGLVLLVALMYQRMQSQRARIAQLKREVQQLQDHLRATEQQLKIKEKIYEGVTPSLLPSAGSINS